MTDLVHFVTLSNTPPCLVLVVEQVVCCKLAPVQAQVYASFVERKAREVASRLGGEKKLSLSSLASITHLKKLCNREFIGLFVTLVALV